MRTNKFLKLTRGRSAATLLLGLALSATVALANVSDWVAPDDERAEPNPIARTSESIDAGLALYVENCATCHGEAGSKGPGAEVMGTLLPDLTDAAWIKTETDGSLFYKIAVGKDPMMAYEEYLNEDEMWHLVNFVRTLTVGGEAETIEVAAADGHDDHAEAGHGEDSEHGEEAGHEDGGEGEAFDPEAIENYEPSSSKAPLAIALIVSIAIGGIVTVAAKKK